jgi:serine/threonine protein kinase
MAINQTLGDYELLELVGKGGQGRVYKAFDTKLKRLVAIKVFHPKGDENRHKKLASFKYEARLASALDHPNICTIYALLEGDEYTYTVMEYVDGKNLFDVAYGRPLGVQAAVQIVVRVADALVAAHEKGIIHRDIKPRNVMLSREGRVVVLDFGLAKLLGKPDRSFYSDEPEVLPPKTASEFFFGDIAEDLFVTVEGLAYGTPSTSPPEMARGLSTDERGDVYSVGGLLYLLLTGTYPFLAKTKKETLRKVINEEPVPVSSARRAEGALPLELIAIVRRTLRKDPAERFQTMRELRERLARVLEMLIRGDGERDAVQPADVQVADCFRYAAPLPKSFSPKAIIVSAITVGLVLSVFFALSVFY